MTIKCGIATSVDGFVAGPNQSADKPFGGGVDDQLHKWMFDERSSTPPNSSREPPSLSPMCATG